MKNEKKTRSYEPGSVHGMLTIKRTWTEIKNEKRVRMVDCLCECGQMKLHARFVQIRRGKGLHCGCQGWAKDASSQNIVLNQLYIDYKGSAKKRDILFDLTKEQCVLLFEGNCYLCGNEPESKKLRSRSKHIWPLNGIDRVNNTSGYLIGNVASCCTACNFLKRSTPHYEFLSHIKRIADYQYSKHGKYVS